MPPFQELKDYVGFTGADSKALRAFLPVVVPRLPFLVDRFYAAIERTPRAAAVLADLAQIERLKRTLSQWLTELFEGPHDDVYYERRLRIGRVHVKVGLPQEFVLTAMNLLRTDVTAIAFEALSPDDAREVTQSVGRIMDMELAIMLSTFMETHEQQELEDFRNLFVTHLPENLFLLDGALRIVAPARVSKNTELVTTGELLDRPFTEVFIPALIAAAELDVRIASAARTGNAVVLPRVQVDVGHERRWYRIRIVPVEHSLARVFLQIEDLTDTIETEARIQRQERLTHLGTMAASVAHEIRNPLAGISSTIQVISNTLPSGDRRVEPLVKVREQVTRLGDLVGDLLSFARPIQVDLRVSDLAAIARQSALQAEAAGMPLAVVEGEGRALVDHTLLGQPLLNLVQNAWQAGAKRVVVEVSDGKIIVCDDGPGIPPEARERVFDAFFTTKTRGTGLGLPVARKVVEAMGGAIELCESPLGGAGFILRLMTGPTG